MENNKKELNVYTGVLNTRAIFVEFLPATNAVGNRIKFIDRYYDGESKTFLCCETSADILQQAVNILYRNGANIICRSSNADFFIINISNWGGDLKIKDLR